MTIELLIGSLQDFMRVVYMKLTIEGLKPYEAFFDCFAHQKAPIVNTESYI